MVAAKSFAMLLGAALLGPAIGVGLFIVMHTL
jgi:hypothetical protein